MTQDPRARSEVTDGMPSRDLQPDNHATAFFSEAPKLAHVVQTLAAHGGGAVSLDLAFDLVLNEVVEQARHATGATGAAIALFRDGELVCRATTGENAPDLGVRVDGTSGLAGACVNTGELQQCRDTETDARVNAEACRRLGVRSMMIAPLVDAERIIGIIQGFSSRPNAFGKPEISALQVLAGRIAESNREAEAGIPLAEPISEVSPQTVPAEIEAEPLQTGDPGQLSVAEAQPRRFDLWGTILVVLVIAAAVLLGLVIGWRRAAEGTNRQPEAQATHSSATLQPTSLGNSEHGLPSPNAAGTSTAKTGSPVLPAPPNGGLL